MNKSDDRIPDRLTQNVLSPKKIVKTLDKYLINSFIALVTKLKSQLQ